MVQKVITYSCAQKELIQKHMQRFGLGAKVSSGSSPQKVANALMYKVCCLGRLNARCGTFGADDLFAHLVQSVAAGRSYALRCGTRAHGAHPSFENCFPKRWPTLLQILQIFGEHNMAQPGKQKRKSANGANLKDARRTERTWRRGARQHDNDPLYVHTAVL